MKFFLGIDLGTQSLKITIFNPESDGIFWKDFEYPMPKGPSMEGYLERDINIYWESTISAIGYLINEKKINPQDIKAVSFSVLGETFVPTDKNFNPVREAFSGHDTRGANEAKIIEGKFGKDVMQKISGQPSVDVLWPSVKILWLKRNQPQIFKKAKRFLNVEDYIIYKLTGNFITEDTMLCTTLYYDISKSKWYEPMIDFLDIDSNLLPDVKKSCEIVGNISNKAAKLTGLSTKTLVVTGAMDQIAGTIGAGNIEPGILTETTGTSLALGVTYKGKPENISKNIPYYFHAIKDAYFLMPWSPSGGLMFKWLKDIFFSYEKKFAEDTGEDIYTFLTKMASKIPHASDGVIVLPYIAGSVCPHSNPNAKASFFGFTINHNKAHLVRATMESIAYSIRENLESMKNSGISFSKIISLGGGSKSPLWCQIKSDINKIPVEILRFGEVASSLGACFIAAVGSGYFKSLMDIKNNKLLESKDIFKPDKEKFAAYDRAFNKYTAIYERLSDLL